MVVEISAEKTFPLRRAVLRKDLPQEPHEFKGDFEEGTFHLGYFENEELQGVVTVMVKDSEAQIRGMAVAENQQQRGIGAALLTAAEERIAEKNVHRIWMNARETAVLFYSKHGYKVLGERFMIKPIGWHFVMEKQYD